MPQVKLTDRFGLSIEVEPNPSSSFLRYFKNLAKLRFSELNANELVGMMLKNLPVKSFRGGISFEEPLDIGTDEAELKVGAGAGARMECTVADENTHTLFASDPYGDPIPISADSAYLSFGLTASIAAGLTGGQNDLSFGVDAGREITITYYTRFEDKVKFQDALRQTLQNFVMPGDFADLAAMEPGSIATVEGAGSIRLRGNANLLALTNPLYDVSLPPAGEISLNAGAAIEFAASVELRGRYQIRVQKTSATTYRFGYYKNRFSELAITAAASAGVSATIGGSELIAKLLPVVSANPKADLSELERAGLTGDQVKGIDTAIKAGLERSLEVAFRLELSGASSHDAAFLYDIDATALDDKGRQAIHHALDGDLRLLTESEDAMPVGITLVKSIFTSMRESKHTLKVNLLGVYNFVSVTQLVVKGDVLHDPLTGELTISDSATARRIRASLANFATDSEKLRKVLAEQFLITILYRSTKLASRTPMLRSTHSYFERHARTNSETMADNLDIAEALGLDSADKRAISPREVGDLGVSLLWIETAYDDVLTRMLFLVNGKPRSEEEYDNAGRAALSRLIRPGEADEYRRRPAVDESIWLKMKSLGQPGFGSLFPGLSSLQVEVIRSDYTVIRWWSQTMHRMALELQRVDDFFAANPATDLEGNECKAVRKRLAKMLASVASNVKEQFGDPWGLIAMDIVSGQRADARYRLTNSFVSLDLQRK
jgi:hypothetical protein